MTEFSLQFLKEILCKIGKSRLSRQLTRHTWLCPWSPPAISISPANRPRGDVGFCSSVRSRPGGRGRWTPTAPATLPWARPRPGPQSLNLSPPHIRHRGHRVLPSFPRRSGSTGRARRAPACWAVCGHPPMVISARGGQLPARAPRGKPAQRG